MKAGFVAASAALIGSVVASHQAHNGFHFRRHGGQESDVCTIYTTVYVTASEVPPMVSNTTVYVAPTPVPETSTTCTEELATSSSSVYVAPPPPSSSAKSTYVAPPAPSSSSSSKSVYVAPPAPSTTKTTPAYTPVAPSSKTTSEESKPTSGGGSSGGSYGGRITPNGQKWSVTFTPYASNGQCMSAGEVSTAISKIAGAGYTTIRIYSTDCGVFENVVPACSKHGLKIIYGIFLDETKGPNSSGANEQLQDIIDNAPKDSMAMLIVGNEYIFGHGGSASTLAPYIKSVKEKIVAAGFSKDIPVTTTETVDTWEKYGKELCDVIDVFAAQVHPFFDGGISAGEAGDFAVKQLEQAAKVCPEAASRGKFITEIGWPKGGDTHGKAVPGVEEQKQAIKSIISKVGDHACLFSYQDDTWKAAGQFNVEQKFGCGSIL